MLATLLGYALDVIDHGTCPDGKRYVDPAVREGIPCPLGVSPFPARRGRDLDRRMRDLADFLLARIAEDEAALRHLADRFGIGDRWLIECETRRRIVHLIAVDSLAEGLPGADVVRIMAVPYVEHADYQEHWRI